MRTLSVSFRQCDREVNTNRSKMASISVFKALILLSFVISSLCYQYIIPGEMGKSKDHEGFCYFEGSDSLIKRGESTILKSCEEVSCFNDYTIQVSGCGTFSLQDPSCLKWERDFTKPYPRCCTSFICVEFAKVGIASGEIDKNTLD